MTFHSARIDGNLTRALAISFVAHVLLLWPALPRPVAERAAAPLLATLRAVERPVETPAAVPSAPPRESSRQAAATARPPILTRPEPAPVEAAAPPPVMERAAVSPAPTLERAAPTEPPAAAGGAPPRLAAAARATASDGLDGDGLRQFRLALAREARRYKRYPERAQAAGLVGTAEVRVEVGAGGTAREARLARSSGHELLDAAAVEMLRQAAPRTALPESLRGRAFAVNLPVVFDLND